MQAVEEPRVHVHELKTSVLGIQYDYVKRTGVVLMPEDCCADMWGVTSYFKRIDPEVENIITVSGEALDTCYAKLPNGQWQFIPHHVAQQTIKMPSAMLTHAMKKSPPAMQEFEEQREVAHA